MLDEAGAEAVAVALIRSYLDPSEEIDWQTDFRPGRCPGSVAALMSPQFREYERIATTVLNAYLTPEWPAICPVSIWRSVVDGDS